jgi:hypothetical protein
MANSAAYGALSDARVQCRSNVRSACVVWRQSHQAGGASVFPHQFVNRLYSGIDNLSFSRYLGYVESN